MCRRKEMQIEPRPSSSTTSVYRVRVGCLYRHSVCRPEGLSSETNQGCNTGLDNWMRSERNGNGDRGQGQAETGREQEVEVKVEGRMAGTWTAARDDVNGESIKCGVRMRFLRVVACVDGNWVTIRKRAGACYYIGSGPIPLAQVETSGGLTGSGTRSEDVQIQQGPRASGAAVAVGTKWGGRNSAARSWQQRRQT
ncbi:hypothetical protein GE21DRAFT_1201062 [Neurospora crassa]|nr:hypothetical protein 8D4.20 [imported] - Neurospora crassa [Neurospora crassa]KHE87799.1 hypothetical protein GE21DRAFT_1201062 [Neurospora crassa]